MTRLSIVIGIPFVAPVTFYSPRFIRCNCAYLFPVKYRIKKKKKKREKREGEKIVSLFGVSSEETNCYFLTIE